MPSARTNMISRETLGDGAYTRSMALHPWLSTFGASVRSDPAHEGRSRARRIERTSGIQERERSQ